MPTPMPRQLPPPCRHPVVPARLLATLCGGAIAATLLTTVSGEEAHGHFFKNPRTKHIGLKPSRMPRDVDPYATPLRSGSVPSDRVVFFVTERDLVFALDAENGQVYWRRQIRTKQPRFVKIPTPTLGEEPVAYITTPAGPIEAVDVVGNSRPDLTFDVKGTTSPTVAGNVMYLATETRLSDDTLSGCVHACSVEGDAPTELWATPLEPGVVVDSELYVIGARLYFVANDGKLYCLNAAGTSRRGGMVCWSIRVGPEKSAQLVSPILAAEASTMGSQRRLLVFAVSGGIDDAQLRCVYCIDDAPPNRVADIEDCSLDPDSAGSLVVLRNAFLFGRDKEGDDFCYGLRLDSGSVRRERSWETVVQATRLSEFRDRVVGSACAALDRALGKRLSSIKRFETRRASGRPDSDPVRRVELCHGGAFVTASWEGRESLYAFSAANRAAGKWVLRHGDYLESHLALFPRSVTELSFCTADSFLTVFDTSMWQRDGYFGQPYGGRGSASDHLGFRPPPVFSSTTPLLVYAARGDELLAYEANASTNMPEHKTKLGRERQIMGLVRVDNGTGEDLLLVFTRGGYAAVMQPARYGAFTVVANQDLGTRLVVPPVVGRQVHALVEEGEQVYVCAYDFSRRGLRLRWKYALGSTPPFFRPVLVRDQYVVVACADRVFALDNERVEYKDAVDEAHSKTKERVQEDKLPQTEWRAGARLTCPPVVVDDCVVVGVRDAGISYLKGAVGRWDDREPALDVGRAWELAVEREVKHEPVIYEDLLLVAAGEYVCAIRPNWQPRPNEATIGAPIGKFRAPGVIGAPPLAKGGLVFCCTDDGTLLALQLGRTRDPLVWRAERSCQIGVSPNDQRGGRGRMASNERVFLLSTEQKNGRVHVWVTSSGLDGWVRQQDLSPVGY